MPSVGSGQEEESVCDTRANPYALVANGQTWRKHGENTGGDKEEALVGAVGEMGEGAAAGGGRNASPNGELRNLTSLRSACESCIVAEESIPKSASRAWATEMSSASRAAAAARSSDRERLGGHTMSKSLTRSIAGAADAFGQKVNVGGERMGSVTCGTKRLVFFCFFECDMWDSWLRARDSKVPLGADARSRACSV